MFWSLQDASCAKQESLVSNIITILLIYRNRWNFPCVARSRGKASANDLIALLLEQGGGNGGIHSSRHGDNDFRHDGSVNRNTGVYLFPCIPHFNILAFITDSGNAVKKESTSAGVV